LPGWHFPVDADAVGVRTTLGEPLTKGLTARSKGLWEAKSMLEISFTNAHMLYSLKFLFSSYSELIYTVLDNTTRFYYHSKAYMRL
jgi:hypothetical protein